MFKVLIKIGSLLLMIAAPIISGKALYEYVLVKYMQQKPSYPFGKGIMGAIQSNTINYLADYTSQMLSIGLFFLAIALVIYLSILVKSLFKLGQAAVILAFIYIIYKFVYAF